MPTECRGKRLGELSVTSRTVESSTRAFPGPGTLTVAGNYMQTAGGTLQIEIAGTTPGQFDLLRVGRHASLAGTLQLIPLGNFQLQAGNKVTFLTAQGGVSGTFKYDRKSFPEQYSHQSRNQYSRNTVQLEGTQGSFTRVACNPNTAAVGGALNSAVVIRVRQG